AVILVYMFALRRSWLVRLLLVIVCAILVGEQGWVHVCPMHSSTAGHQSVAIENNSPSHSTHHAAHSAHGDTQSPQPQQHDCNCLGDCTSAVTAYASNPPASNVPAPVAVKNDRPRIAYDLPTQT